MAVFPPVNPNASTATKEVLAYLYSLMSPTAGLMTGQHNWLEDPSGNINNLALPFSGGKYPAVSGYEMGPISGQSDAQALAQRTNVSQTAIAYWKAGGIPTFTWHQNYPLTTYNWSNVQRATTQAEFNQCLTPGDPKYAWLLNEYDKVAAQFKMLRDQGVPILFRPYHEMNGYWFWWGKKSNFAALWNLLYDRFTTFHGLNNILWVWSPNCMKATDPNIGDYKLYYPGANRVDVLAWDIYNGEFTQSFHDNLYSFGGGKPIALGEVGQLPSMSLMQSSQYRYTWCLAWGEPEYSTQNTDANKRQFYSNSYAITRDEVKIPDLPPDPPDPPDPGDTLTHFTFDDLPSVASTTIATAPKFVGQIGVSGGKTYVGMGTAAASNWQEIGTGGSSGDLLLASPDGTVWKLVVSNSGVVSAVKKDNPPPVVPDTIFSDDFNRANSATTLGAAWTANFGTWGISSNKAYTASNVNGNIATHNLGADNTDIIISCLMSGAMSNTTNVNLPLLVFKLTDVSNYWNLLLYNGELKLTRKLADVDTDVKTAVVGALVDGREYAVKASVKGKRVLAYFNNAPAIDYTMSDTDFAKFGGASTVGMKMIRWGAATNVTARWDDFLVTTNP